MADGFGPDGQDPRDGSQQNNTYHYTYNYSYGSGRGTTPPGGNRPPKNSNDWGEWVGIGFLLFILPFWFCKVIGVIWLLNKLGKITASDKRRYKQEAKNAANRARNTAQDFFRQANTFAQAASGNAGAGGSQPQQDRAQDAGAKTYRYSQGGALGPEGPARHLEPVGERPEEGPEKSWRWHGVYHRRRRHVRDFRSGLRGDWHRVPPVF